MDKSTVGFTRDDMRDCIAEAISDSMDDDWGSLDGAESVMRECGVWELYEALDKALAMIGEPVTGVCSLHDGDVIKIEFGVDGGTLKELHAALAKARGDTPNV